MRAELLERYQAIPLPTKSDEHWRFTDLRGFDPEAFAGEKAATGAPPSMLALDVAAEAAPAGVDVQDVTTAIDLSRLDLSRLSDQYLAPTLGTMQIRSAFDGGVLLPWES